jgi:hypothetical protein
MIIVFLNFDLLYIRVADPSNFGVDPDPDPRPHASDQWIRIRIRMRILILLFSSLPFKTPTKNKFLK